MLGLRVKDLWDCTHSGPEGHRHVRIRCHPWNGLVDGIPSHYRLLAYEGSRVTFQGDKHNALPRPCMIPNGTDS